MLVGPRARKRRGAAVLVGAAALLVAPLTTGMAGVTGTTGPAGSDDSSALAGSPTGPRADEMAEVLELQPGGVQVSDNALAWNGGDTIVVWPSPGESRAPDGLGDNVRTDVIDELDSPTLKEQARAETGSGSGEFGASADFSAMGSYTSCPSSYYCFYTSSSYNGVRYQFSSTCSGFASSWGFSNQTSSWVNRYGTDKAIYAWNSYGSGFLWYEPHSSRDSYVGSSDNNRMSYWTCTHT